MIYLLIDYRAMGQAAHGQDSPLAPHGPSLLNEHPFLRQLLNYACFSFIQSFRQQLIFRHHHAHGSSIGHLWEWICRFALCHACTVLCWLGQKVTLCRHALCYACTVLCCLGQKVTFIIAAKHQILIMIHPSMTVMLSVKCPVNGLSTALL